MPVGVSAYTALANITLGSAVATVSFTSINQTYRDLVVVVNAIPSGTINWQMLINNLEDGGRYNQVWMLGAGSGNGSSSSQESVGKFTLDVSGITSSQRVQSTIHLFDYAQTDKHKSLLWRYDNPAFETVTAAGRFNQTTAVTSIQLRAGTSTWAAGSTFALYGVSA
jgi:hypothetical protein